MELLISILNSSLYIFEVIVALGVLVTVHEFGHFIVAKACGMKVDEFAVGFGKAILSFRKGETLYSLRILPLGGYNRIYGMEIDEENTSEEVSPDDFKRAFNIQPAYKRAMVIFAGSFMNIVLAVILVFILRSGWGENVTQVYSVNPNGPAWKAGMHEGDIIYSIADKRIGSMNASEVLQQASREHGGVKVVVQRQEEQIPLTINPESLKDIDARFWNLGAVYFPNGDVTYVWTDSPASKMGLLTGDYVNVKDGKIIERYIVVDGRKYVAVDIHRQAASFTLALPKNDAKRVPVEYTGLGFFYDSTWTVVEVQEYSALSYLRPQAYLRNVRKGDRITSLDIPDKDKNYIRHPIEEYTFGVDDPFRAAADGPIDVSFMRGDTPLTKTMRGGEERRLMGITLSPMFTNIVNKVDPDSPIFQAGLREHDEIIAIANEPVDEGLEVLTKMFFVFEANRGNGYLLLYDPNHLSDIPYEEWESDTVPLPDAAAIPATTETGSHEVADEINHATYVPYFSHIDPYITLKAKRDGGAETLQLKLKTDNPDERFFSFIGFGFYPAKNKVGFFDAWRRGFVETGYYITHIADTLKLLFNGQVQFKEFTGPVGILNLTYQFASSGIEDLLTLVVLLTVNLAIINMLPFPALDGGRMVFLVLEMVFRRPVVSVKIENVIHLAGILLILAFVIYLTIFDIGRIFG